MTTNEQARYILNNNIHMTIATADKAGKPWISTVGYAMDEEFNLYWVSHKDHLHSRNIRSRKQVAVVVFGKNDEGKNDGVYIDGEAFELSDLSSINKGMKIMARLANPPKFTIKSIDDVRGDSCWRIYMAIPNEVTKRANAIDESTGQAITIRTPVFLDQP